MTIPATASEISYAGNGVTVAFAVPFVFDTSADLKVTSTDSSGNVSVLTTGFSVTGGSGSTGTVTFDTAPASGVTITILDDPDVTQPTDYQSNDAFPAESHERALDRGARISKRLSQLLQRAFRFADGDPITDGTLGSVDNRKGKYLFFNAVTGAIEYAVALVTTTLSQSIIGQFLNPQTDAEVTAGVVPQNYWYEAGNVFRYMAPAQLTLIRARNVAAQNGTTVAAAVQAAFSLQNTKKVVPPGSYSIKTPLVINTSEHLLVFEKGAFFYYDDTASPASHCLTFGATGVQTGNIHCWGLEMVLMTSTAKGLRLLNAHDTYWYSPLISGYQPPSGLAADWQNRLNVGVTLEAETGIDSFFNTFYSLHVPHTVNGVRVVGGSISTQHIFYDFKFYGDSIFGDTDTIAFDIQGAAFSRVYGGYIEAIGAGGFGFRMQAPSGVGTTGAASWKVHDMVFDTVTTAVNFASGTEENKFYGCTLAGAAISDSSAAGSGNYVETTNNVVNGSSSEATATNKQLHYSCRHYTLSEEPVLGLYFANGVTTNELLHGGGRSDRNAATNHQFYTAANNTTTTGTESFRIDHTQSVGFTRFMVWDVDNGQLERVSVGAADSGGVGFKVLRIPN